MSGANLLGHRVHPMLVLFPVGLLGCSVIFDIVRLASRNPAFGDVSYWLLPAGIFTGLAAAVFGFWDWTRVPAHTRAKSVGVRHALANVVMLALFTASWGLRGDAASHHVPAALAQAVSFAGFAVMLVSGWLGGELVERLGVGIYERADINAPSSLSKSGPPEEGRGAAMAGTPMRRH